MHMFWLNAEKGITSTPTLVTSKLIIVDCVTKESGDSQSTVRYISYYSSLLFSLKVQCRVNVNGAVT